MSDEPDSAEITRRAWALYGAGWAGALTYIDTWIDNGTDAEAAIEAARARLTRLPGNEQ